MLEASGERMPPPALTHDEQLTYWVVQHQKPLLIPAVACKTRFLPEMDYL